MSEETAARARSWCARRDEKNRRMESVRSWMDGPVLQAERIVDALHLLIQPHDRIVLEGDNQKQAEFSLALTREVREKRTGRQPN